jgi:hypothetical protein
MDIMLVVLKWVVLILLAGFIGQFGKSLSIHIIDYFKRRKNRYPGSVVKEVNQLPIVPGRELSANESRPLPNADKRGFKAQITAQKKASKG